MNIATVIIAVDRAASGPKHPTIKGMRAGPVTLENTRRRAKQGSFDTVEQGIVIGAPSCDIPVPSVAGTTQKFRIRRNHC